jgi:hypothetical protein
MNSGLSGAHHRVVSGIFQVLPWRLECNLQQVAFSMTCAAHYLQEWGFDCPRHSKGSWNLTEVVDDRTRKAFQQTCESGKTLVEDALSIGDMPEDNAGRFSLAEQQGLTTKLPARSSWLLVVLISWGVLSFGNFVTDS